MKELIDLLQQGYNWISEHVDYYSDKNIMAWREEVMRKIEKAKIKLRETHPVINFAPYMGLLGTRGGAKTSPLKKISSAANLAAHRSKRWPKKEII